MLNQVHIIGHLGKAPEIKQTQSGQRFASFTVATTERWTDKTTDKKRERTEWHRVVVWSERLVELAGELNKGSKVWVVGALATRPWTDDKGVERFVTEIILKGFRADLQRLERIPGVSEPGEGAGRRNVADPEGQDDYGHEREYENA
jgi:single-strand DNA-binding protein